VNDLSLAFDEMCHIFNKPTSQETNEDQPTPSLPTPQRPSPQPSKISLYDFQIGNIMIFFPIKVRG